jgi:PAS domain S-box-containing protein
VKLSSASQDVTEYKPNGEIGYKGDEWFRFTFDQAPVGMAHATLDGLFTRVNCKLCKILGYTSGEMLGLSFHSISHPGDREAGVHAVKQLISGESESYAQEWRYCRKDGSVVWAHVTVSLIRSANSPATYFSAMVEDISSRKECEAQQCRNIEADLRREIGVRQRAEDELRRLSSRLLNLRDAEQRRIARDLHDTAGQLLTATTMNLASVAREAGRISPEAAIALSEAENLIQETIREIRVVSHLLHPPLLDETGLYSALRWYLEGFSTRGGVKTELVMTEGFGRLSVDLETTVFRIVQESLTNIHRHSESKTAKVQVVRLGDEVRVEVEDKGKGMVTQRASGVGLSGMRERVGQFGGKLEIQSSGTGTTVIARIPVAANASRRGKVRVVC